jgi:tetratricopeptide (TPR) repeat protein
LDDDSDSEIAYYEKAIELDTKFAPAYYRLGAIYFRQAEYDLAAENFSSFLLYASDTEKQTYNVELYFSPEDLEALREVTEEPVPEEGEQEVAAEPAEVESAETVEEVSTETTEEVEAIVRFSTSNGHMVVPVLLNESRNSSLLFDTGASITVLSTDLARSLGLRSAAGRTIRVPFPRRHFFCDSPAKKENPGKRGTFARAETTKQEFLLMTTLPMKCYQTQHGKQHQAEAYLVGLG